jgi:peroxiredoxin
VVALEFAAPPAFAKTERKPLREIPAFRLEGLDGQDYVARERLAGRTTLLVFWRLEQPQSLRILEDLVRLRAAMPPEQVAIVSVVSGDTDRAEVARLVAELEVTFPVLFDPDRQLYGEFGVIVSPSVWFADSQGQLRFAYPGYRRDFSRVSRTDLAYLRGKITDAERAQRLSAEGSRPLQDEAGPATRHRLARRLLANGDREAAQRQLWIAWKDEPRLPEVGVELGLLQLADGHNDQALAILEETLAITPEDPRCLGGKGVALIRLGSRQEGAKLLRRAIADGAAEPSFYYEMGIWLEDEQGPESASPYYRRGLELMLAPNQDTRADAPAGR